MKRDPFTLPQSLILAPEHDFEDVRLALIRCGFTEVKKGIRLASGKPKSVHFSHTSGFPTAQYTYHGPTDLGMLHLATVPPQLRGHIAEHLPWITPYRLIDLFKSPDPKTQIFALWAAREDERVELLHDIRTLASNVTGQVQKEAETIAAELGALAKTQLETIAGTQLIAQSALPLIAEFRDPDVIQAHLPTEGDCALLFEPQFAGPVAKALKSRSWPTRGIDAQPSGFEDVFVGPAGLLRWPNSVSDRFPRGYRTIAGSMIPSRVWMGWTSVLPYGGTLRFDGLVFAQGRWIFFPRPFRIVAPLLPKLDSSDADLAG